MTTRFENRGQAALIPLILLDALGLAGAWLLAAALRFETPLWDWLAGPAQRPAPWASYLLAAPVVALVGCATLAWAGLYRPSRVRRAEQGLTRLLLLAQSFVILLAISSFIREVSFSRLVALSSLPLAWLAIGLSRRLLKPFLSRLPRRAALVVGGGALARRWIEALERRPGYGLRVLGCVSDAKSDGLLRLGPISELEALCQQFAIRDVFLAMTDEESVPWRTIEARLRGLPVDLHWIVDSAGTLTLRARAEMLAGMPLLTLRESPNLGYARIEKRAFDLILGLALLLLALPILLVIAIALWLSQGRPILFAQRRISWEGHEFWMWKFRSMRLDAEAEGPKLAKPEDPRRTALGAWLRRSSLDELPQLWNVLRGEMSLVGPRPERPELMAEISASLPHFAQRLKVKAGMTGWAQIHGQRGDAPFETRLQFDLDYLSQWSLGLDLKILLLTLSGGFLSKKAF